MPFTLQNPSSETQIRVRGITRIFKVAGQETRREYLALQEGETPQGLLERADSTALLFEEIKRHGQEQEKNRPSRI